MKKIKEIIKITWEVSTGLAIVPVFAIVGIGVILYVYGQAIVEIITEGEIKDKTIPSHWRYCEQCEEEMLVPIDSGCPKCEK